MFRGEVVLCATTSSLLLNTFSLTYEKGFDTFRDNGIMDS